MNLRTRALDCLYLNWALPRDAAPDLPAPVRYELHEWEGEEYVFGSALLFRLSGLRLETVPFLRLSHPQMNFRLYVLDEDDQPAVLFRRMLVPWWAVPASRLLGRQPASSARFRYPQPSRKTGSDRWSWSIQRGSRLEVEGKVASPRFGPGPRLGTWEATVDYFRQRQRGYVEWDGALRPIRTPRASAEAWPLSVEVRSPDLVAECCAGVEPSVWSQPHSAWLCPEIPFVFDLGDLRALSVVRRGVPAAEGC